MFYRLTRLKTSIYFVIFRKWQGRVLHAFLDIYLDTDYLNILKYNCFNNKLNFQIHSAKTRLNKCFIHVYLYMYQCLFTHFLRLTVNSLDTHCSNLLFSVIRSFKFTIFPSNIYKLFYSSPRLLDERFLFFFYEIT